MSITTTPVDQNGAANENSGKLAAIFGGDPWRNSTPAEIRKAGSFAPGSDGWDAWRKLLKQRGLLLPRWKRESASPLLWGLSAAAPGSGEESPFALVAELHAAFSAGRNERRESQKKQAAAVGKRAAKLLESMPAAVLAAEPALRSWLAESADCEMDLVCAVESLAWAYVLPRLADDVDPETWWLLVVRLVETAQQAQHQDPQGGAEIYQLLAGELPLVLMLAVGELHTCRDLGKAAAPAIVTAFDQLLDGDGTPHRDYQAALRPLAASWARCQLLVQEYQPTGLKGLKRAYSQFDDVLLAIARTLRPDGSQHLISQAASRRSAEDGWVVRLLDAASNPQTRTALAAALDLPVKAADLERAEAYLPAANNAEWSELAILRTSWNAHSPRVVIDYGRPTVNLEISAGKHVLFAGDITTEVQLDGRALEMNNAWSCVCWQSDSDCDYIELETHPASDVVLQRSIMLAHEDGFVWIADSVASGREHLLDHRLGLTLGEPGLECRVHDEHTEAEIVTPKKPLARVLPLALSEWRSESRDGTLVANDGQLAVTRRQHGWGLYSALFIDLQQPRLKRPFTWRRLTVAENRQILPPDLAVAQRVNCGDQHWVFYRSVGTVGNRTFLGVNISSELLVARFETDGEYETMIEVQ